ncbi:MAG: hypothetical protein WBL88_12385 [Nitrososphaeraceae archaeon]
MEVPMECRDNTGKDGIHTLFTLQGPGVIRGKLFLATHHMDSCHNPHPHIFETLLWDQAVDSFASYFQFPRSATNTLGTVERILGIPTLGTAFIAIRRKFERVK